MSNLIEKIKTKVIEQKLANNEEDFCNKWLSKNKSYLRVLRHKNLEPSMATLLICADRLGYYAQSCENSKHDSLRGVCDVLRQLAQECRAAVENAARKRWQGFAQI